MNHIKGSMGGEGTKGKGLNGEGVEAEVAVQTGPGLLPEDKVGAVDLRPAAAVL